MMAQSQIFQRHQNYVVWPRPALLYPPQNAPVFPRPVPFNPYSGQVGRKRNRVHRTEPGPNHGFRSGHPNRNGSHPQPANRSGGKGRRFRHRKRKSGGGDDRLEVPSAPHNTTSFLRRAWRNGGIPASPSMPTPPTPPVAEGMAFLDEYRGVLDDYGTMEGMFRLRLRSDQGEEESGAVGNGGDGNRADELEMHIMDLQAENLTLRERVFLLERELGDVRNRVHYLENDAATAASSDGGEVDDLAVGNDNCSEKSVGNDNRVSVSGDSDGDNNENREDA